MKITPAEQEGVVQRKFQHAPLFLLRTVQHLSDDRVCAAARESINQLSAEQSSASFPSLAS